MSSINVNNIYPFTTNGPITLSNTTKFTINSSLENGNQTVASGNYSHAEGLGTTALQNYSHAEGYLTKSLGGGCHSEGFWTTADAIGSHTEGYYTTASGYHSHAEGSYTMTSGYYSHAEGQYTSSLGESSHAEGVSNVAIGNASHVEGSLNASVGYASHAEGVETTALADYSHTEGIYTIANGQGQHVSGLWNLTASTEGAFIIGNGNEFNRSNLLFAANKQVEVFGKTKTTNFQMTSGATAGYVLTSDALGNGRWSQVTGSGSSIFTGNTPSTCINNIYLTNINACSPASSIIFRNKRQSNNSIANGTLSHAEGLQTTAQGSYSHSEGNLTTSLGLYSHSEGYQTTSLGLWSHSEGLQNKSIGVSSHAEGLQTTSIGNGSHTEGLGTIAQGAVQTVVGRYNLTASTEGAFIIGNGLTGSNRSNLLVAVNNQVEVIGKTKTTNFQMTSGATAGYVLTSDALGNGSWQLAQSNGFQYYTVVTITNSQILTLSSIPVQILPQPGVNKYYDFKVYFEYTYGTTTYISNPVYLVDSTFKPISNPIDIQLPNNVILISDMNTSSNYSPVNSNLNVTTSSDPTNGDGSLKVKIYYNIIDFG
jgi:hypothetical protein